MLSGQNESMQNVSFFDLIHFWHTQSEQVTKISTKPFTTEYIYLMKLIKWENES